MGFSGNLFNVVREALNILGYSRPLHHSIYKYLSVFPFFLKAISCQVSDVDLAGVDTFR